MLTNLYTSLGNPCKGGVVTFWAIVCVSCGGHNCHYVDVHHDVNHNVQFEGKMGNDVEDGAEVDCDVEGGSELR